MTADFHRYYGLSWARRRSWGIPLSEVADMAAHLPVESATWRDVNPHWRRTIDTDLLRLVEHSLRWLVWAKTVDGERGRNIPHLIPMPWDEPDQTESVWRGDALDWDDTADALGGDPRLRDAMQRIKDHEGWV